MASATSSSGAISSTLIPTVIISVGAPLGASLTSNTNPTPISSSTSSRSAFITNLAPSALITVVIPQSSSSALSSLSPAKPSSNSMGANHGISNSQSFPIGLIAGIITGFSILVLVMGIMFAILWRNKRIKVVDDSEAKQMHEQQSATRAYYMPPPPPAQTQHRAAESEETTPIRSARFAPEVATPWRVATSSPRRSSSGDVNKPWPPTPRIPRATDVAVRTSASPLRQGYPLGGRVINHPHPLRAHGLATPSLEIRAVPFTPSKAALLQRDQPSPSQSLEDSASSPLTNKDILPPSTHSDGGPVALRGSTSSHEVTASGDRHRDSELTRADSTAQSHFALSPPPRRRPQSSGSEATKSMGEGRLSRTPGLRLSGVSQDTVEPADNGFEGQKENVDGSEADSVLHRTSCYGEVDDKNLGHDGSATPPGSRQRRFSQ